MFFCKEKNEFDVLRSLVGAEECIGDGRGDVVERSSAARRAGTLWAPRCSRQAGSEDEQGVGVVLCEESWDLEGSEMLATDRLRRRACRRC